MKLKNATGDGTMLVYFPKFTVDPNRPNTSRSYYRDLINFPLLTQYACGLDHL